MDRIFLIVFVLLLFCFQVEGVLLVAPNANTLAPRRKEFMRAMKDVLSLKHDQRATSHKIAFSLEQVKV